MYTGTTAKIKRFCELSTITDQINEYSQRVRAGQIECNLPPCSRCKQGSDSFKRHEARQRIFYTLIEQIITKIFGLLIRWECPVCGKTFTGYPGFILPYKRYVLPVIMAYGSQYTENEQSTYRNILQKNPAGYQKSEQQLDHSTIHRWISSLGSLTQILRKAQDLILQAKPESTICRDLAALSIPSKKYRKKQRAGVLLRARQLFSLEGLYRLIFNTSIFPNLATACSFG